MKLPQGEKGIIYTILDNKEKLTALWTIDNIECAIGTDCREEELIQILRSISTMEEK